jgi:ABC-type cobalamin/Fe3+-siderophores transport system ATPase subunit
VVVLIGPNNAGKSLALREIDVWSRGEDQDRKVVDSVDVDFPTDFEAAIELLRPFMDSPSANEPGTSGQFTVHQPSLRSGETGIRDRIGESSVQDVLAGRHPNSQLLLRKYFSKWHTIRLDGRTRFELTDEQVGGDLLRPPANHLLALAQNDAARNRVRSLTAEAFGVYFVLDFLYTGRVRIRMSLRPPSDAEEELALSSRAQAFHGEATPIEAMSDGVKSFTGLVAAVQSLPHRILLVDEPEAFLHPPLARRLGRALASLAHDRNASLVVGTHSAEFVLGCIEQVSETSVVRLGYEAGVATARELPAAQLGQLAHDPLLRSTNVLRALFHRAAVVTEADADRAFYDEMNQRLDAENRGVADALFLNAQGRDTIDRLVLPLRQIGIPTAAIVDLDVIELNPQARSTWKKLLNTCGIPSDRKTHLSDERTHLAKVFDGMPAPVSGKEAIKYGGVERLDEADRARAHALLSELADYGLFLVPRGELEAWLPDLAAAGHGKDWVVNMFGEIGATPADPGYLRPADDDVWAFIDRIRSWVSNPNRRGIL